jgi:hypothetical protein
MGPSSISKPFSPFSFSFSTGAHKLRFLNHFRPLTQSFSSGNQFHYSLAVHLFITHSGTHAHYHIYLIHVHIFYVLFRYCSLWVFGCSVCRYLISIWFTSLLQVYIQHWHVVSPTVLHLHPSHTL